jgi:hypothetical protein
MMSIEKLLENSKLKEVRTILSLSIIDSNFGELYLYFTPWENNHYRAELFFKDYKGYVTPLDKRTLVYKGFEKLVLNIDTISQKVVNLCEKTKDGFIEEFRVDRPTNDLEQETCLEEFNLIIYNVEVGSANAYGDSWYLSVYTNKLETELTADNYNKEELCKVLTIKHNKFMKKLSEIVFNCGG